MAPSSPSYDPYAWIVWGRELMPGAGGEPFTLAGGPSWKPLPVLFTSLETPDLFKEGAEVVLEGRLAQDGPGARFHDGRRVTSKDVAWSYNTILDGNFELDNGIRVVGAEGVAIER